MSLNKEDVWADLRYALDELDRPPRDIRARLTDAADLDARSYDEFSKRLLQIALLTTAYAKAKVRADTRIAHEAIEKGLKAILIDGGVSENQLRSRGHKLHLLLADVQQHNPTAFGELTRVFDSTIRFLESVTTIQHSTNILDYFRKHGKAEVLVENRYASIEPGTKAAEGMIECVYGEVIRALLSLMFGWSPNDINYRIEQAAREAILAVSKRDSEWNAAEWLSRGPVRPRLEVIQDLTNNGLLRAGLRRVARESTDSGVRYWAKMLRSDYFFAKREARAQHQAEQSST